MCTCAQTLGESDDIFHSALYHINYKKNDSDRYFNDNRLPFECVLCLDVFYLLMTVLPIFLLLLLLCFRFYPTREWGQLLIFFYIQHHFLIIPSHFPNNVYPYFFPSGLSILRELIILCTHKLTLISLLAF